MFIARATRGNHPIGTYNECGLDGSFIKEKEIEIKNCRHFKRKYGAPSPARRKLRNFVRWSQRQWKLHSGIMTFTVGTVLTILAILVGYLVAKGIL